MTAVKSRIHGRGEWRYLHLTVKREDKAELTMTMEKASLVLFTFTVSWTYLLLRLRQFPPTLNNMCERKLSVNPQIYSEMPHIFACRFGHSDIT
ncbi:hypothetical protein L3X38_026003 [Prunus dulcis]|uniref:Uncharacterized protein n=1 Tax=Prunus dulcis TaxID=3755 RepID=A0AAD4W4C9_PRUDU|nr:hypothetical protein L3X38_026003 [Prunus dulcis]